VLPFLVGDTDSTAETVRRAGDAGTVAADAATVGTTVDAATTHAAEAPGGAEPIPASGSQAPSAGKAPVSTAGASSPAAAGSLGASDRGVTHTSIKVGFLLVDIGGVGRIGFSFPGVDPAQQQQAAQAYVDDINARGGILGRTIEPVFRSFDVLNEDDQRAKCVELTRDERVFAVIAWAGFMDTPMLCVTVQHATPLIAVGETTPNEYIDKSQGRLVIFTQAGNRLMANLAHGLHTAGLLQGKKIGVVDDVGRGAHHATDDGLLPTLERLGYRVTHVSRLAGDMSTAASQTPVEVQQMRSKGVDLVVLSTQGVAATQFVQNADAQGWRPQWVTSDWEANTGDSTAQNMPAGYDGAIAVTQSRLGEWRDGIPEPEPDAACREIYERATNQQLPRSADGRTSSVPYSVTVRGCNLVRLFELSARLAGPELTRESFSAAVQRLGDFPAAYRLGASFGPGKFDAPDVQRLVRYHYDCKCWRVASNPHRSAY
jgi:hypothetical protein